MTETDFIHRKIGRITWTAYQAHLVREPIVFLPVGALEQHGPHLPMGCDAIFSEEISLRLAEALNGLVLPPLTYGYKSQARSGGGQLFPGTTSLDGQTLTSMVQDILREVDRHGVKRVAIINGHVENQWFLTEGIDLALREAKSHDNQMQVIRCEYWNFTPQNVLESLFEGAFPGVDLEHAALIETSMMLALYPSLVDLDNLPVDAYGQFPNYDTYPQNGRGVPASGVLAPASQASAEKGSLLISSTVNAIASALRNEFYQDCRLAN